MPSRIAMLPKTKHGIPIPYVVLVDKFGEAHFRVNNEEKNFECMFKRKCHICGQALLGENWFIGGHLSAFHERGAFNDGPTHKDCGLFALKVCPYLANNNYKASTSDAAMQKIADKLAGKVEKNIGLYNPTQMNDRLQFFCFCQAPDYALIKSPPTYIVRATKPYISIEYWKEGEQITLEAARQLLPETDKHLLI